MAVIIDEQIDASADDGFQVEGTGVMNITAGTLTHKSINDANYRRWGAYRWDELSIPQGSTINVAYVTVRVDHGAGENEMNVDVHFEKAAAPVALTIGNNDITDRERTTNSVLWDATLSGWENSPSLIAPLQEVVDAHALTSIVVIFKARSDETHVCYTRAWDYTDHSLAAKLYIEYTVAPAPPPSHNSPGTVIRSFAAPAQSTQGITWDGRCLWVCDAGTDLIYQIDPETGTVIRSFATPGSTPVGLAFDGRCVWNHDRGEPLIYQIDPETGTAIRSFATPSADCHDITFDGRCLWIVSRVEALIYQIDPETGTVIRSFAAPSADCRGLTWDGRTLYCCDLAARLIYQIDPETGTAIRSFATPANTAQGLTWDGRCLWLSDGGTNLLYQIVV